MSRRCLRPLIIEPKKPLKTEAKSRFRAKPHGPDNPYYRSLRAGFRRFSARFSTVSQAPTSAPGAACRALSRPLVRLGRREAYASSRGRGAGPRSEAPSWAPVGPLGRGATRVRPNSAARVAELSQVDRPGQQRLDHPPLIIDA